MLRQFYGALQTGRVGETFKVMARDPGTAQAQLASVYEHPEILDLQPLEVYFGPFADCADGQELVKGFAAAERNRDQIVAVAPHSAPPGFRHTCCGATPTRHPTGSRRSAGCATTWGGLRRVTTVPHAKFFWPEEHLRLLKEFWASAN